MPEIISSLEAKRPHGINLLARKLVTSIIRTIRTVQRSILPAPHIRRYRLANAKRKNGPFRAVMPSVKCRMIIYPDTFTSYMYEKGDYEIEVVRFIRRVIRPGMVCVDIGAHVGYFSLLMAKLVGPRGRVISFEPTARSNSILRENSECNNFRNIIIEPSAVGDAEGETVFYEATPGFEVYNSVVQTGHPAAHAAVFAPNKVPLVTLDSYLESKGIRKVDLIKIDVEGSELLALRGMRRTLHENPGVILLIEYSDITSHNFGYKALDVAKWLGDNGLYLSRIDKKGLPTCFEPASIRDSEMIVARYATGKKEI